VTALTRYGLTAAWLAFAINVHADQPAGVPPPGHAADRAVSVDITPADHITCHGMASFDKAGLGTQQLMYTGPGIAGFLAQLATHSALVAGEKSAQKRKLQEQADAIVEPYRSVLDELSAEALLDPVRPVLAQRGILLTDTRTASGQETSPLHLAPVFFLAADQRAFALEGLAEMPAARSGRPPYSRLVRVVGKPTHAQDPAAAWHDHEPA
jgi:hypothetical protein